MNLIKTNNNLFKFNKNFKKLQKNVKLKNLKLLFSKDYDVVVFANFNFYNSVNINIFKDVLEKHNIKYSYINSNDFKYYNKSNFLGNFWNTLNYLNGDLSILNKFFNKKSINFYNIDNKSLDMKEIFSKNFNIILFLSNEDINNNVLETLKIYTKVDPLYLKFKNYNKLMSYDYLVNNLIKKDKSLVNLKPVVCKYMLHNQIRVLKMFKYLNENNSN